MVCFPRTESLTTPFPIAGCMIVEIEEFKQATSKDNSKETEPLEKTATRVVLRPNSETLFADLCLLNQKSGNKWTDKDALEIEAKILVRVVFGLHVLFAVVCALTLFRSSLHLHPSVWIRTPAWERSRTVSIVYHCLGRRLHYDQRNARRTA